MPESPRRGSTTGGNPLKSDLELINLMEQLEVVNSYDSFQRWKETFLSRFESFLGDDGSNLANHAYQSFRNSKMERVVKKVSNVSKFVENGDLSVEKVTVKARNAMNELSTTLLDTVSNIRDLVPPTSADEMKLGYTKYHLGAVLVRDGFEEYERLNMCNDVMKQMKTSCIDAIGDTKMIEAMKVYDDEISRFVSLMEDLGLYKIMLKNRQYDPNVRDILKGGKGKEKNDDEDVPSPQVQRLPSLDLDDVEATPPPKQTPRKSATKYDVKGSWGGPLVFGDSNNGSGRGKLDISQDLAAPKSPSAADAALKARDRGPESVFVTPARNPKKKVPSMPLPLDGDQVTSPKGAMVSDDASILTTDTPRTRKAKQEWSKVKAAPRLNANPNDPNQSGDGRPPSKPPKPPKPPKESRSKDQGKSTVDTETNEALDDSIIESLNAVPKGGAGESESDDMPNTSGAPPAEEDEIDSPRTPPNKQKNIVEKAPADDTMDSVRADGGSRTSTDPLWGKNEEAYVEIDPDAQSGDDWLSSMKKPKAEEDPESKGSFSLDKGANVRRATSIRKFTFCSVDDSVDPKLLGIISRCYPLVEFAVLLRPDMAGSPRYASLDWLQQLTTVQEKSGGMMRLAAHLCGNLVNEVLRGDDRVLTRLEGWKFQRVQINLSGIYGVYTYQLEKHLDTFLSVVENHPNLEIIVQKSKESKPLWEGLIKKGRNFPSNMSLLFDESKGRGVVPQKWTAAPKDFKVGYAGGIGIGGRYYTKKALKDILKAGDGQSVWVSMESSMRCTKNGKDVFDIDACYQVIDVASELKIQLHPDFVA